MPAEPIPPALSAAEWADYTADALSLRGILSSLGDGVGLVDEDRITARDLFPRATPERHHHAAMALHNYALPDGHAGKVTRAMVEAIREAAHVLRARLSNPHFGMADDRSMVAYHARQCDAAAAALAALLPPAPVPTPNPRPLAGHSLAPRSVPPVTYTVTIDAPDVIEAITLAFETGQRVVVTTSGAPWDPTPPIAGSCAVVSCALTRPGEITAVLEDHDGRRITVNGRRADGSAAAPVPPPSSPRP